MQPISKWIPLQKGNQDISILHELACDLVEAHPLQQRSKPDTTKTYLQQGELDPLSMITQLQSDSELPKASTTVHEPETMLVLWNSQKQSILKEFSSERFVVNAVLFDDVNEDESISSTAASQRHDTLNNRSRARLEQLIPTTSEATVEISEQEYSQKIQLLQRDLISCWGINQRVLALRIAIKSFKLLGDVTVPKFYPSMFVLVSDTLEKFGHLVYQRIQSKALLSKTGDEDVTKLPDTFTSQDISVEAKETCRNWFYKTSCIRELLPRIYTEMALLQCYRFLSDGEYPQIIHRLSNMIRGIGDPIVALYARTYLALVGSQLMPPNEKNEAILGSFYDYLYTFQYFKQHKLSSYLKKYKLTEEDYLSIHSPGVQWLLKCVAQTASPEECGLILEYYSEYCNNSMVLYHIVESFSSSFLSTKCLMVTNLIQKAECSAFPKVQIVGALAGKLIDYPPKQSERLSFLNESWKNVINEANLINYLECVEQYIQLCLRHYSSKEIKVILKDVVLHLNTEELFDTSYLERILYHLVTTENQSLFMFLLTSDDFMTLLNLLKQDVMINLSKHILETYQVISKKCDDPTLIHTIFEICRHVHDSVDYLTSEPEQQQIAQLICSFINSIEFAPLNHRSSSVLASLQQQFNVYIDCRAIFNKIDTIRICLVHATIHLIVKARPCGSTSASKFIKSCLAYCYITIPSISSELVKFQLFIQCAEVGIYSECLSQTDSLVRTCISLFNEISDLTVKEEQIFQLQILKLIALLILIPGGCAIVSTTKSTNRINDAFYSIHGLLNGCLKYSWKNPLLLIQIRIMLIPYFSSIAQVTYKQQIPGIEHNDVLYGGNQHYQELIHEKLSNLLEDIFAAIAQIPDKCDQNQLILELLNQLIQWIDFSKSSNSIPLLVKLFKRLHKQIPQQPSLQSYYEATMQYLHQEASQWKPQFYPLLQQL